MGTVGSLLDMLGNYQNLNILSIFVPDFIFSPKTLVLVRLGKTIPT